MRTTVLIIGAGAAGLRVAIELAEAGVDCLVVGKRRHGDAHTRMAAGGINAVLNSRDAEDRWELHAADTIREGGFLSDPRAVELLAREAPARVEELAAWGCLFARTDDGRIDQRYFGAQSFRRTCFVGDVTGQAILETLVRRARSLEVPFREHLFVTGILVGDAGATGALALDLERREPVHLAAPVVVLAAGGFTSLYHRSSSRPDENTGDAVGLAWDAGADLRDMEMVQFHPTGMVEPAAMRGRLVTEAVRGEGGRLYNVDGERFMERYAPDQMELAARDVVARANDREIRSGRGTAAGGVLLDISHRDEAVIRARLPRIHRQFLDQGVDITSAPMEVAPTAHYPMGGVRVDPETGATGVPGLYAVGEAASGVHGANRLGGNSLAETVVFGRRTGAAIAASDDVARTPDPPARSVVGAYAARLDALARAAGHHDPLELTDAVRRVMDRHAGITRSGDGLRAGIEELDEIRERTASLRLDEGGADLPRIVLALGLPFMLRAAEAALRSALLREESRGAHFREDAPEAREAWNRSIIASSDGDGGVRLRTEPIPEPPAAIRRALDAHHTLDYHHLE